MSIKVCVAGATGWAGSELSRGIAAADDLDMVAAVARSHAGQQLGEVLNEAALTALIFASVDAALTQPCDVYVDYTSPASAKGEHPRRAGTWRACGDRHLRPQRRRLCADRRRGTRATAWRIGLR